MYELIIGSISQSYDNLDSLMNDCFEVFPEADFGLWNENLVETWQDVFESHANKTIVGKIIELP